MLPDALHRGSGRVSLAAVALVVVAIASPHALATPEQSPQRTAPAADVVEDRGDVVELALDVPDGETATVEFSGDGSYRAVVNLTDADGDGTVDLRLNTYLAGHGDAYTAVGADEATVEEETSLDGRLPAGNYTLVVRSDDGTTTYTVRLRPVAEPTVKTRVAINGSGVEKLRTVADVRNAIANGNLPVHGFARTEDRLVVELHAPGLAGAMAAAEGPNATARFLNVTDGEEFSYRVREKMSTVTRSQVPLVLSLSRPGAHLVAAPESDTYYAVYHVARASTEAATEPEYRTGRDPAVGDAFAVTFTVHPASGLVTASLTAHAFAVRIIEEFSVSSHTRYPTLVTPSSVATLTGTTTFPPGTRLVVWANATNGSFQQRRVVTVRPDSSERGRVNVSFDLDGVPAGTEIEVTYRQDGRLVGRDAIHVVEPNYSVTVETVTKNGSFAEVVADVTVPRGGFAVVHIDGPDGPVLGHSDYLPPGHHENVSIVIYQRLAFEALHVTVHRDDGNRNFIVGEDIAYVVDGTYVTDRHPVPEGLQPTPEPTASPITLGTPTPTATPSPTATDTPYPPLTGRDTPTTTPGLGTAAGLVALAAAAALLARR